MSLTSTEAADTLSTSVLAPSTSAESITNTTQRHLRRRMHALDSSRPGQPNGSKPSTPSYDKSNREELTEDNIEAHTREHLESSSPETSPFGFESHSIPPNATAHVRGEANDENYTTSRKRAASSSPDSMSRSARAWYEFDLSVVVALASPIGKWFTGGDHVRNFLLILLLIFYLHQIIEIPWTLYHNSRPRRRVEPHNGPAHPHHLAAASELRSIEFIFLVLTIVSPLLGAMFLRFVIAAVSGTDALSWFSTGLFVLATGMRPWRHLIDRFNERTHDLHNVIHYPPTPDKTQSKIDEMSARIDELEKTLAGLRAKVADTLEDVYGYMDDAVDAVQSSNRKHEKKYDKQEARLKEVEDGVASLRKGKDKRLSVNTNLTAHPSMALISFFPSWLGLGLLSSSRTPHRPRYSSQSTPSKHALRSYPSSSSVRLESIPEEDTKPVSNSRPFRLHIPGAQLVLRWGDLATLPLRRVIHYLLT